VLVLVATACACSSCYCYLCLLWGLVLAAAGVVHDPKSGKYDTVNTVELFKNTLYALLLCAEVCYQAKSSLSRLTVVNHTAK